MSMNEANNYKQLLELAVLDAHGLLEPIETDLFNRSFHDAPASIQDEIIEMQRAFAEDDWLLPTDSPHKHLKQKVLKAVSNAADNEARRLAPLALIGARAAQNPQTKVKPAFYWRIAALILFGVATLFGILAVDANHRATRIAQIAMDMDAETTIIDSVGSDFKTFLNNPYCNITWLSKENSRQNGRIRISINERFGNGYIVGLDLLPGEEIIIQGKTLKGKIIELARITSGRAITGQAFEIDKALIPGITIVAFDAKTGVRWV